MRAELQDDLSAVFARLDKAVIVVTHDLAEAAFFARRLVLLRQGRVVQEGSIETLLRAPAEPFVTHFVEAQRRLTVTRNGGTRVTRASALALFVVVALGAASAARRAAAPRGVEGVRRIGDPGRGRRSARGVRGSAGRGSRARSEGRASAGTRSSAARSISTPSTRARCARRS